MNWAWRRWLLHYRRTRLQRLDERALERASGHLGRGCGARWLFAVPLRFAERKLRLGSR